MLMVTRPIRSSRLSLLLALLATACSDDPMQPDPGPAEALVQLTIVDDAEQPVPEAVVRLAVYLSDVCGVDPAVTEGAATTDGEGMGTVLLEAASEYGQRSMCLNASVEPPPGSGLAAVSVEIPRIVFYNTGYVPEPHEMRLTISLQPAG
jgi:hypothetical protein